MLHYPYVQLYRKQVVKQSDLILAMHKRGDAFTPEQKARNLAYYEELTVRDSSLSACTQAVLAAEVGHLDLARAYLDEAALMDLYDLEHNTGDGLHMASLAGALTAMVAGFGGLRDYGGELSFRPRLAPGLNGFRYSIALRGSRLGVEVRDSEAAYKLLEGGPVRFTHWDEEVELAEGDERVLEIPPPADESEQPCPGQPPGREPGKRRPPLADYDTEAVQGSGSRAERVTD
jgi:alpha,alpha-trehalose phosphorylase